eukprot:scaffold62648_cov63-Attheya_sp.AAC.2
MVDTAIAWADVHTVGGLEFISERNSTGEADRRRENNKPVGYQTASMAVVLWTGQKCAKGGAAVTPKKSP